MDRTKLNHTNQCYECGLGKAYLNIYNGRLLFDYPLISIGMNNFEISSSLVYNSHYKLNDFWDRRIGFGNGWKLNIEQHLFEYQSSYEIQGFLNGDYVYIDSNWIIHRFVKYKTNNNKTTYYDDSGSGLRLVITNDDNLKIYDVQNNIYCFNKNGYLINLISGVNEEINKEITYDNNYHIESIYDKRKQERKILFTYDEDLLNQVLSSENDIWLSLSYDSENKLEKITKHNQTKSKDLMRFLYNDKFQLEYTINCNDQLALRYFYNNDILPKVNRIDNGAVRKYLVTENNAPEVYVGEDVYFGENYYVTNSGRKLKEYMYYMPEDYRKSNVFIHYYDAYTICENDKGIAVQYSFNKEGKVISNLEKKSNFNYYTLFKPKGWILLTGGSSNVIFNCVPATILKEQNSEIKYDVPEKDLNYFKQIFYHDTEKYSQYFTLSFWMKFSNGNQLNRIATLKYIIDKKEYLSKVIIEDTLIDSWQRVSIPINLGNKQTLLSEMTLSFEDVSLNTKIIIADMRIEKGKVQDVIIGDNKFDMLSKIYYECYDSSPNESITPDFYMTNNDIFQTYLNLFYSKMNNQSSSSNQEYFDLVYCNGTKVKLVKKVGIQNSDCINIDFTIDDKNIPNYYLRSINVIKSGYWTVIETQMSFHYDELLGKYYYETKTSYGIIEQDPNLRLNEENASIVYNLQNQDGTTRASKSTNKVIKENIYDKYGNIESIKIYNEDDNSEVIDTIYEYLEEPKLREMPSSIIQSGVKTVIDVDLKNNALNFIEKGNKKAIYSYDDFKENLENIEFIDKEIEQTVSKNDIVYSDFGFIKIMKSSDGIKYGFNYDIFNEIEKVYRNKELIIAGETNRSLRENVDVTKIYKEDNEPIETITLYDEYGNVISEECNGKKIEYSYEVNPESLSLKRLVQVNDPYINNVYNISYYDETDVTSETIELPNQFDMTIYSNDAIEYKSKTDNEKIKFKSINENVLSSKVSVTSYSKGEENDITGFEDFNFNYSYDKLDRFNKKTSCESIFNKGEKNEVAIFVDKGISYQNDLPIQLDYTVHSNIKNKENDSAVLSFKNEYDHNKNIVATVESGNIYKNVPLTTETQLKTKVYEKINKYSYDSFNRLIFEKNYYFGDIEYKYGKSSGMIEKIIKNGVETLFIYENGRLTKEVINGKISLIEYDHYGNIVKSNKANITYNDRNLMERYISNDTNVQYNYNYQGYRTLKIITRNNETNYVNYYFNGDTILGEDWINANNEVTNKINYFYDAEGISGLCCNDKNYTFIRDSLGNINKIMYKGKIIGEYIYDGWGNHQVVEISIETDIDRFVLHNNPFRYKGYYYDIETGLYWVSTRYYSPELCRWLTPDSIEYLDPESINGLNLYCYCNNNPIMYVDPSGHFVISALIIGAIIGATVGFGAATYIDYKDDGKIFNGSVEWYDYLGATLLGGVIGAGIGYIAPQIGSALSSFASTSFTIGGGLTYTATGEAILSAGITFSGAEVLETAGLLGLQVLLYSEHSTNKTKSNREKHEKGNARRARDQGGLKRKPPRKVIKKSKYLRIIFWWLILNRN